MMVPEAAGTIVDGAATGATAAGTLRPAAGWTPGAAAAGAAAGTAAVPTGAVGAPACTVIVWVTVAGAGTAGAGKAGCGRVGSAEAVVLAKPTTPATPA